MKRVIIALSMLAFAITAAFIFTVMLINNINAISADISHLGSVSQTASDEEITAQATNIISKWNKMQRFIKIIAVHENLNVISQSIHSLGEISSAGNRALLGEKCREICVMLSVFANDEKITIGNIF